MKIRDGKEFDVIVAGAGPAGFCAAVQAARGGLKVGLFEHFAMPGGALTVLGNNSIDQFNNPHRPRGDRQVIAGIGWEFVQELARRGFARIPDMDVLYRVHWQYGVKVNPLAAAQCMDDFLLDAGVQLYYRQGIVDVETAQTEAGEHIDAAIVSTKAGLTRFKAKLFIDCTGDGDLCAWAGAEYELGKELQPGTLRLYPDRGAPDAAAAERADALWREKLKERPALREMLLSGSFQAFLDARGDNTNHVPGLDPTDSAQRSQAEIQARRDAAALMEALQESGSAASILASAPESAAREGRRILGDVYMTGEDYVNKRVYGDAVCYTYWFIDMHRPGMPSQIVYLKDALTPTVSLGALRPKGLTNVFTAGRCVSSDRACNSAIRVKASCMAMGQAAGAAAVIALQRGGGSARSADAQSVRAYLKTQGAIVP